MPVINFDQLSFLSEFEIDGAGRYLAASAPLRALRAVRSAFAKNFAFADSLAFAPALFARADAKDAARLIEMLGLSVSSPEQAVELAALNPMQALTSQMLMRRNDGLRDPGTEGAMGVVLPDYQKEVTPERVSFTPEIMQSALAERDKTIADLTSRVDQLQQRVDEMQPGPGPDTPRRGRT